MPTTTASSSPEVAILARWFRATWCVHTLRDGVHIVDNAHSWSTQSTYMTITASCPFQSLYTTRIACTHMFSMTSPALPLGHQVPQPSGENLVCCALCWGLVGGVLSSTPTIAIPRHIYYWGYIGIMEKKMETTGIIGIIVYE